MDVSRFAKQSELFSISAPPGITEVREDDAERSEHAQLLSRFRVELLDRLEAVREMCEPMWSNELEAAAATNDFRWKSECLHSEGADLFHAYQAETDRLYNVDPDDPNGYSRSDSEQAPG